MQVFGLLDLAVGQFKGLATGVNGRDASNRQVLSGGKSTSHFGLHGSEDMGGGLVACSSWPRSSVQTLASTAATTLSARR